MVPFLKDKTAQMFRHASEVTGDPFQEVLLHDCHAKWGTVDPNAGQDIIYWKALSEKYLYFENPEPEKPARQTELSEGTDID